MKALTLINPVRRGRRGRFVRSARRSTRRRTRIHRNPVRSKRRKASVRRSRHHSAAMRAKISRAVKAANRRRGGGSAPRRRVARRTTTAVAVRSFGRGSHHSPAMRAKISRAVRAANARRRGGGFSSVRRRFSRHRSGGGGVIRGVGTFNLKSILSKPNLELAGGAIGAGFLTTYVVSRFGANLPGITNTWARLGYKLAIPVAGAFVVKRFSRNLAQGMVLGGIITVLNDLIATFLTPAISPTSAYLNATPPRAFGAYLGAPQAQRRFTPSYNAVNSFGAATPYTGGSAFAPSAW